MSRRVRSLLLASLAIAGAFASTGVVGPQPASATAVLAGLDCGIEGEMNGYPPDYILDGVVTAGPYVAPGTDATVTCTLRIDDPGGPVVDAWSVSSPIGTGTVPAMVPEEHIVDVFVPDMHFVDSLWLCSRVTWQTVTGPDTEVGCEKADPVRHVQPCCPGAVVHAVAKPQDADLDNTVP